MANKAQILATIGFMILTQASSAAVYNCRMTSPKPSLFFDRNVKIECDLDSLGKPKFVFLSGTSKVALNQKAEYVGTETGNLYEKHRMMSLDGRPFELHSASRLFTETAEGSFFTVEPERHSAFYVCYLEE